MKVSVVNSHEYIPNDWSEQRLATVCNFQQGKAHEPFIDAEGEYVCATARFISTNGESARRCTRVLTPAKEGDILMVMSDLPNGRALARAFFVEKRNDIAVNQRVARLRFFDGNPRFFLYQLDRNIQLLRYDDGSNQTHLPNRAFTKLMLRIPSLVEQNEIADFLDRETARIDLLIEKKQRLVALLGEKYKAEKKRLVFDLDNQSVERSASTVSWFPDIPKHWRFMRCAHIFNNLDYRRIPLSSEQRGDLAKIYPYYGASGIIDAVDDYLFDGDTILVGEDGANLVMQSTPIAFKASGKYWVNNHAHILTPRFGNFDYWIHALNQVPYEVFVTGSAQPKLTSAVLGNIRLPVPPKDEQAKIAQKIEIMGQRVNTAIEPISASIDRLREYRSALITAAVTGQIDVSTYSKSGATDRRLDAIQAEMGT